jgi:hypothetical protein
LLSTSSHAARSLTSSCPSLVSTRRARIITHLPFFVASSKYAHDSPDYQAVGLIAYSLAALGDEPNALRALARASELAAAAPYPHDRYDAVSLSLSLSRACVFLWKMMMTVGFWLLLVLARRIKDCSAMKYVTSVCV